MNVTAYQIAQRFVGLREVAGHTANPQILAMLRLDCGAVQDDETPWCSAFVNYICWLLRLPRSKSLLARSWLTVGEAINYMTASPGYDVVVLKRGEGPQPGPNILTAPGHVGFYAGMDSGRIHLLGGNQGDAVTVAGYDLSRVLGVRRLC